MLLEKIKQQITEALKSGDKVKLSTLKMLSAAVTNAEIAKKREKLTEEEELGVVRAEAKKRKDAIEMYTKVGEKERADAEKSELEILQEYLPKELSDEELSDIVSNAISKVGAKSMADMGKVMGAAMGKTQGRADGKKVMEMVKTKLG